MRDTSEFAARMRVALHGMSEEALLALEGEIKHERQRRERATSVVDLREIITKVRS